MNESHFFLYFLYNMDLHNLRKEGMACTVNLKSSFRKSEVRASKMSDLDFKALKENFSPKHDSQPITMPFTCARCENGYKTEQSLKTHLRLKHPELNPQNPRACPTCDKILSTEQRLKTHMKIHLVCKICKDEFPSELEMLSHKKGHTSCPKCQKDFLTESGLKRHGICKQKGN